MTSPGVAVWSSAMDGLMYEVSGENMGPLVEGDVVSIIGEDW